MQIDKHVKLLIQKCKLRYLMTIADCSDKCPLRYLVARRLEYLLFILIILIVYNCLKLHFCKNVLSVGLSVCLVCPSLTVFT